MDNVKEGLKERVKLLDNNRYTQKSPFECFVDLTILS